MSNSHLPPIFRIALAPYEPPDSFDEDEEMEASCRRVDIAMFYDRPFRRADRRALDLQISRPDDLTRACMGEFNHD